MSGDRKVSCGVRIRSFRNTVYMYANGYHGPLFLGTIHTAISYRVLGKSARFVAMITN